MVLLFLMLLTTRAGEVAMPGAAEQDRFWAHFTQGEALYQQGEYGAAIWNFRQADRIRVTPEVAFDLAKCHEKIGDLAFSTFWYRQYLKREPNANDALDVAERVGKVLARAEGEGRGLLEVVSPGAKDLTVGKASFVEGPMAIFLAPGEYELSALFPSGTKTMVAQIRTGKTTPISFEPMPPPLLDANSAEVIVTGQGPGRRMNKIRLLGIVASAVGLGSLAVGIPFQALSSTHSRQCCSMSPDPNLTYEMREALAPQANQEAILGNTFVLVGAGLLALGLTAVILSFLGVGG